MYVFLPVASQKGVCHFGLMTAHTSFYTVVVEGRTSGSELDALDVLGEQMMHIIGSTVHTGYLQIFS